MLETADEGSHRGDPPVFCNSVRTASSRDNVRRGETDVPPLAGRGSGDEEAAVHDAGVWVADEAVAPLLQPQHEALRPREFHARKHAIETGPAQVEVVNVRLVADDEAVRLPGLQLRHLLAV